MLEDRDYTLIIDNGGSMSMKDQQGGRSRWDVMQEYTIALASKCEQLDPDGITVYIFSTRFRRYENVTANKVKQIFKENEPLGRTEMADVLQHALEDYFDRQKAGQAKPNGETILVVTDEQSDNHQAVVRMIANATQRMDRDDELAISFIQIGNNPEATAFLNLLDDELQNVGAKFDIVDTITIQEMEEEGVSLLEVLLNAVTD